MTAQQKLAALFLSSLETWQSLESAMGHVINVAFFDAALSGFITGLSVSISDQKFLKEVADIAVQSPQAKAIGVTGTSSETFVPKKI